MTIDHRRRISFDDRADAYDAIRPSYPDAVIDAVAALGDPIVEVGAGTGKATVPLARRGRRVIAIEPGARMAELLRRNVAGLDVEIVEARFEDWTAPRRYPVVMAAQSFHWVDPELRYRKAAEVLLPGGVLALLRNDKAPLEPALRADLDRAYAEHLPAALPARAVADAIADLTAEIDASRCFGPVEVRTCPWSRTYSADDYARLLLTYSDHAVQPRERLEPFLAAIHAAIARNGGSITLPYVAVLHLARTPA